MSVASTQNVLADVRQATLASAGKRDATIDTLRGMAILMVIAIHSLPATNSSVIGTFVDAALRPCVPMFLFASGYLTAKAGSVPLAKRLRAVFVPYAVAFCAAYLYMALENPEMDHRPFIAVLRFIFGYVFVYYYVFVYAACMVALWVVLHIANLDRNERNSRLFVLLCISLLIALVFGAYFGPALREIGLSEQVVNEARMRDIPVWFAFVALGMLIGMASTRDIRFEVSALAIATALAYLTYATVRLVEVGDAATYDSIAFFAYSAGFCLTMLLIGPRIAALSFIGSGSYFIYLWHIFIVYALKRNLGVEFANDVVGSLVIFSVTITLMSVSLVAFRKTSGPRVLRLLGA